MSSPKLLWLTADPTLPSDNEWRQMLADFVSAGGTALEVVAGANGAQHVEAMAALAVKYGLMGSVGSDFHDPQLTWNPLGRSLKLPDCVTPVWRNYINEAATP